MEKAVDLLGEAQEIIDTCAEEERESFDNLPEGVQESERGQQMEENADNLEDVSSNGGVAINLRSTADGSSSTPPASGKGISTTLKESKVMKTKEELVKLGLDGFKADEVMLLESKMLETAVRFQFKKKDGSLREAVGTLVHEKMVQEDGTIWEPVGESKPEHPLYVRFWDLTVPGWRQFNVFNLIAVEG